MCRADCVEPPFTTVNPILHTGVMCDSARAQRTDLVAVEISVHLAATACGLQSCSPRQWTFYDEGVNHVRCTRLMGATEPPPPPPPPLPPPPPRTLADLVYPPISTINPYVAAHSLSAPRGGLLTIGLISSQLLICQPQTFPAAADAPAPPREASCHQKSLLTTQSLFSPCSLTT